MGSKKPKIDDKIVDAWVTGLPDLAGDIVLVSLLGRKPDGLSEFSYYSFRGGFDRPEDRPGSVTWQQWLTARYGARYRVCEFPTVDTEVIPGDTMNAVIKAIRASMDSKETVIVVDSGGVGRTGNVVSNL